MNLKFFELPPEKQKAILNAAMEIFATREYKRASTDDIAAKAGISKGLLFYYFHNKKELYFYLYQYCFTLVQEAAGSDQLSNQTDFFDLLAAGAQLKLQLIAENPYIMDFTIRAYFSENEAISEELKQKINRDIAGITAFYFQKLDTGKFREGIHMEKILEMLTWMTDGYINQKRRMGNALDMEEMMRDFEEWVVLFRRLAYEEEYWL